MPRYSVTSASACSRAILPACSNRTWDGSAPRAPRGSAAADPRSRQCTSRRLSSRSPYPRPRPESSGGRAPHGPVKAVVHRTLLATTGSYLTTAVAQVRRSVSWADAGAEGQRHRRAAPELPRRACVERHELTLSRIPAFTARIPSTVVGISRFALSRKPHRRALLRMWAPHRWYPTHPGMSQSPSITRR